MLQRKGFNGKLPSIHKSLLSALSERLPCIIFYTNLTTPPSCSCSYRCYAPCSPATLTRNARSPCTPHRTAFAFLGEMVSLSKPWERVCTLLHSSSANEPMTTSLNGKVH